MAVRVGIRELRQNLSVWLRRVEQGESFEVTDHGKPVAVLAPVAEGEEDVLDRLERSGQLAQRGNRRQYELPERRPSTPTAELLDELRAD
jgi:prevent-host-death family protein